MEKIEARAKLSHARISARKVKIVIDLIRGKNVSEALADFFGVLYSVNRANNLNIPNLKAARELAAAMCIGFPRYFSRCS